MLSDPITAARKPRSREELPVRVRRASTRSIDLDAPHRVPVALPYGELSLNRGGADAQSEPMTWRLGLLTDRGGHVHLGAVVTGPSTEPPVYVDLLAAVGAASPAELDLDRLVVLVRGEQVANLRRVVEQCIDNVRLRNRLIKLTNLSGSAMLSSKWTA